MLLNYILLQAEANGLSGQNPWMFWGMMILIFVVFYFFMIRPQRKKQKEIENQRNNMKVGDTVVTAGGIYGKIKEVQDKTFLIEVSTKGVLLKVDKGSVYAYVEDAQAAPKDGKADSSKEAAKEAKDANIKVDEVREKK